MLKRYSSDASGGSDEASSTGSDAAGREIASYRAWSDTVSSSDQPGSAASGVSADPALVGDTFIFESSWTDAGLETVPSGELSLVEQSSSPADELASRATTADGSTSFALADSHDIPIWGLASDDFSFI